MKPIAAANPEALTAAKADLAHGGNCGEHAKVAFDFLRATALGETLNRSAKQGLDHAFVILGDLTPDKESDADLVVADPWPTAATACVWEDHFAYTADRQQIQKDHTMVADGQNQKVVIAAGLKLSAKGEALIKKELSESDTEDRIKNSKKNHIWQQPDSAASGKKYQYETTAIEGGSDLPAPAGDTRTG